MNEDLTTTSFIPPTMLGYDETLKPYAYNPAYAQKLMKKVKLPPGNLEWRALKLLHTNGVKTIEIAKNIQRDLKQIGLSIELIEMSYKDGPRWGQALAAGKYDLFLMGYKADIDKLYASEEASTDRDSYGLIAPLFRSNGGANFTGYNNPKFDQQLDQIEQSNRGQRNLRDEKLKQANRILYKDLPAVVLFYIEKI